MSASSIVLTRVRRRFVTSVLTFVLVSLTAFYGTGATVNAASGTDVTYAHDPLGRLTGVIDPSSGVAQYVYDALGNTTAINRFAPSTLSLVEFSPATAASGTRVTIYGSGFNATPSSNVVKFNGLAATVVSGTQTQLVVTVPSGLASGPISVNNGSSTVTSARSFIVPAAAPAVTSLSASVAVVGASVTITGSRFDPTPTGSQVLVNGTRAVVTAATSSTLTFTVPPSATSGPVTVIDNNGIGTGPDLYVPAAPYQATDIGFRARVSLGTATTVTIATAGQQAMLLFTGTKGHKISVLSATGATMTVDATVYAPSGASVASLPFGSGSFLDPIVLPESGTYTIFLSPRAPGTGTNVFTVYDVPADATKALTYGTAGSSANTVPGQNLTYTFSGTAGHRVSLNFTNASLWALLSVKNPDGTTLVGAINSLGGTWVEPFTLAQTGTYVVYVDPSAATTGTFTVTVYDVPSARTINIDFQHIIDEHTLGGATYSPGNSVFSNMTPDAIKAAVRAAYQSASKVAVHGDIVILRGQGGGLTIEMVVNRATGSMITAYPVNP